MLKRKRIVDAEFLSGVRLCPCLACAASCQVQRYPTEADHITTRGAGGDDTEENVWPLCTFHHRERHDKGLVYMFDTYAACYYWLELAGREDILGRKHK